MLEHLADAQVWESFYQYKQSLTCPKADAEALRAFIDERGYADVCARIEAGEPFPLPRRREISKMSASKKRIVYVFPEAENTVLKLLTYLLLRKYDGLFCRALFSFRPGRSAKDAIRFLLRTPGIRQMYAYKVDVSDYFNSIPIPTLLPLLETALADDAALYGFLRALLTEPRVIKDGEVVTEQKGIMAGTPIASFLANLYLNDLDRLFCERGIPYARYSDDIIVFAPTGEQTESYAAEVRGFLRTRGLSVNPKKEAYFTPSEGWTFLGFSYCGGVIDIAPATVEKLKGKMRRKARALQRWRQRSGIEGEKAAKAFIRIFNRKLLEQPDDNALTWSFWFFSVINSTARLHEIDRYAQECVRYLVSGTRTKARFNVRYADMKQLGYRSLVHAYYDYAAQQNDKAEE